MARLIRNADLSKDIKEAFAEGKKEGADEEEIGINTILNIICSCSDIKIEGQFYNLLAGITEKTADTIENQSLEATISDIKAICEENNIINFLKSASRLSKTIKG